MLQKNKFAILIFLLAVHLNEKFRMRRKGSKINGKEFLFFIFDTPAAAVLSLIGNVEDIRKHKQSKKYILNWKWRN